jgi:hypothetical protein
MRQRTRVPESHSHIFSSFGLQPSNRRAHAAADAKWINMIIVKARKGENLRNDLMTLFETLR